MTSQTYNSVLSAVQGAMEEPAFPLVQQGAIGGARIQTVNARDLHRFLEVGKDFSSWIKERVEQYGFIENADFLIFTETGENSGRGRPAKEYAISIDMAKELAMVERNEKGKQARQYFIECERRTKAAPVIDYSDPVVLLGAFRHLQNQVAEKDEVIAGLAPKAEALDRIAGASGSMCITDAAKTLKKRPSDLIAFMSARQWIYKRPGNSSWLAYQAKIQAGFMEHKDHIYADSMGQERVSTRALVTAKGLAKLAEMLEQPLH